MNRALCSLLLYALLSPSPGFCADAPKFSDGWRYTDFSSKLDPFFSEFKYFNFQDARISGVMTYAVISPGLSRELKLNAYFYESGRVWTIQKSYPLKCVKASPTDVSADFCKQGGIEVAAFGPDEARIRVRQDTGPLRWDLTFTAPMSEVTREITHIPLDGPVLSWFMNWAPILRSGQVEGSVTFFEEGRTVLVSTTTLYHDENWEVWNPLSQPFNWLHFTAKDSRDERVDLTLVEFPRNSSKAVGLQLFSNGARKFWPPGQFKLSFEEQGRIPITRRHGKDAERMTGQDVDRGFSSGEHPIATRYHLSTDDDQLDADLDVFAAISTAGSKEGTKKEFLVDEQLFETRLRFLSPSGEHRTASGPGEFMRAANGEK